jgi:WD40-like Beta Propeller Repeat
MKHTLFSYLLVISISISGQCQQKASNYLGQPDPGSTPTLFAPGLVSTEGQTEFGSVFSKDGNVFYYAAEPNGKAEIRSIRFKNNVWGKSEVVLTHSRYGYNDPFLSPDEKRLYFISDRAIDGKGDKKDYDIWYIEEKGVRWSGPINAGNKINSSKNEYYISFTKTGTMYFSSNRNAENNTNNYNVYCSKKIKGEFQTPVKLSNAINSDFYEADVFVAPDESYLIFSADKPGGYGSGDLYISFLNANGTWMDAKNVGNEINGERSEYCPFVTTNGKYFFYTKENDIYWVDTSFINKLK